MNGVDYDVLGFPIFKDDNLTFTVKLDEEYYVMKDTSQFKECTRILREAIEKGEVSRELFTPQQIRTIMPILWAVSFLSLISGTRKKNARNFLHIIILKQAFV